MSITRKRRKGKTPDRSILSGIIISPADYTVVICRNFKYIAGWFDLPSENLSRMMRNYHILIFIIGFTFLFNGANAQVQWKWAKNIGNSMARTTTIDIYGNIFVAGEYGSETILFDTIGLTNQGGTDAYIVKFNDDGKALWAKGFGGIDVERARSVCTDPYGNIYVAGEFWSDSVVVDTFVLKNQAYGFDIFIIKFNGNGDVVWARSAGGDYIDYVIAIAASDQGEVYITGSFWGTFIRFDNIVLNNSGNIDMYVAKFDVAGNAVWAYNGIGNDQDEVFDISVDKSGNIYLAGSFKSDSISFGNKTLINSSDTLCFSKLCFDAFVVKYSGNGIVQWAVSSKGKNWEEANGITVDTIGNIYMAGIFMSDTVYFDTMTLTNVKSWDVYISKFNLNGNVLWVKSFGGNSSDYVHCIALDADTNIYIGGGFDSDSLLIGSNLFINQGYSDLYVAKFDNSGNNIWAKSAGGTERDYCMDVSVDLSGNIYSAGYFNSNSISFDTIILNKTGNQDMFFAKIGKQNTYSKENTKKEILKIYPNPFHDLVHIEFDNQKGEKHYLEIYTASGKLVRSINEITTGHVVFERMNLIGGVYFFRLWNNRQVVATGKLIVE